MTGYEPFDRFELNPSGIVARRLDGQEVGQGFVVRSAVMPVDCEKMPGVLAGLIEQYRPARIVGLGLAAGISAIQVERLGHNWIEITGLPDNGGHQRQGDPVIPAAPLAYASTLPVKGIVEELLGHNIPAYLSDHAGTHLCNQMLFTALHWAAQLEREQAPLCGFIHLPAHPELVVTLAATDRKAIRTPSMSLELMQQAVHLALAYTVRNL